MSEYIVSDKTLQQIDMAFVPKAVAPDQLERCEAISAKARELALLIASETPPSREQSLAFTNLEHTVMWASAAIARHERHE